jgi:protein tyrosine phosphatase (PTP) superfamily phosphohydrolase (DUF442 family)
VVRTEDTLISEDAVDSTVSRSLVVALLILPVIAEAGGGLEVGVSDLQIDVEGEPLSVESIEGVERNLYRDGRVFIGGQPSREALESFQKLGVTAVINLRTPSEMEDRDRVPYDEEAAVEELGMEYVAIPLGGPDHPYNPAAVDVLASELAEHEGLVLLHCTMGWRAAYLWVAYLIRDHGFSLDDALVRGRTIAIPPSPLEGFLGRPMRLVFDE